jgi:hypothetical protein
VNNPISQRGSFFERSPERLVLNLPDQRQLVLPAQRQLLLPAEQRFLLFARRADGSTISGAEDALAAVLPADGQ